MARILALRGLADPDAARRFLQVSLNHLHPPETLPGIDLAAERIHRAVLERQRVVIYGDYDVDGITAAALLWRLMRLAHADARVYIPHRVEEGYGLNREAVQAFAREGVRYTRAFATAPVCSPVRWTKRIRFSLRRWETTRSGW